VCCVTKHGWQRRFGLGLSELPLASRWEGAKSKDRAMFENAPNAFERELRGTALLP